MERIFSGFGARHLLALSTAQSRSLTCATLRTVVPRLQGRG